jgi:hypothetical protein
MAIFSASATHNNFDNIEFDMKFETKKFMILNTKSSDTVDYYGKLYTGGNAHIQGNINKMSVDAEFSTLEGSEIFVSSQTVYAGENTDFITFNSGNADKPEEKGEYISNLQLDMALHLRPDTKIHFITNPATNDQLVVQGIGNMHFVTDQFSNINIFGDYEIEKGIFQFTIEKLYGKKFEILPQSKITWTGETLNPQINISTVNKLRKVKLFDLTQDENDKSFDLPVNCYIYMKEKMMQPKIAFGIETKDNDKNIGTILNNMEEDEINKQFLSLLILNRFLPMPGMVKQGKKGDEKSFSAAELLSGRVGSQISVLKHDMDVGVNYRQNSALNSNEIELDFSTGLLNDRMEINGNIATGEFQNSTGNIVGDFTAEVKLSDDGRFKLKAFNTSNRYLTYESGPYTQGVGLFFRTQFDRIFKINRNKK